MDEKTINIKLPEEKTRWKIAKLIITPLTTIVCSALATFSVTKIIQSQTQVVIEPRDGDIIVEDVGDGYKLLQLLTMSDVVFPSKIQEIRCEPYEDVERIDINNINNEDWSNRDGFRYMIDEISLNSNKIINLLGNISKIDVFVDFYLEKNISTKINFNEGEGFSFELYNSTKSDFNITTENQISDYAYVTKEVNNGIEWMKVRLDIVYTINKKLISDRLVSDWIPTDADIF